MRLTQAVLAKRLGVRREVIARIETGKRNISLGLARKLSALSGISVRDIRMNICLFDQQRAQILKRAEETSRRLEKLLASFPIELLTQHALLLERIRKLQENC
jgi:DNA-binding XRE family transcriptional regulator